MNQVLLQIERALVASVTKELETPNKSRTKNRTLSIVAACVALSSGTAVAALGVPGPIDDLLRDGPAQLHASDSDSQHLDLSASDESGASWEMKTYITKTGLLATAAAPEGSSAPAGVVGGSSGFSLAASVDESQGLASMTSTRAQVHGAPTWLIGGTVDALVRSVTVDVDGDQLRASMGHEIISLPTAPQDGENLTEAERQLAKRLPDELRLRMFAVAFGRDIETGQKTVRPKIVMTFDDGHTVTYSAAPGCFAPSCS